TLLPDRLRDGTQKRVLLLLVEPAGRVEVEPLPDPRGASPQLCRESGFQLDLRRGEDRAQAQLGRRSRDPCEEQRLRLIGRQPRQPGPISIEQLVAPGWAAVGV